MVFSINWFVVTSYSLGNWLSVSLPYRYHSVTILDVMLRLSIFYIFLACMWFFLFFLRICDFFCTFARFYIKYNVTISVCNLDYYKEFDCYDFKNLDKKFSNYLNQPLINVVDKQHSYNNIYQSYNRHKELFATF